MPHTGHQILGRLNLQAGSLCNCPSLISILVILALSLRLITSLLLPVAHMGQQNSHVTKSNMAFGFKMPFRVETSMLRSPQEVNVLETSLPSHGQGC